MKRLVTDAESSRPSESSVLIDVYAELVAIAERAKITEDNQHDDEKQADEAA